MAQYRTFIEEPLYWHTFARTAAMSILATVMTLLPAMLVQLGLTETPFELFYRDATVLVGLVYTSMLFVVVPLISALESLDDTPIEAAYDLRAIGLSVLRQIVIPHAAPGVLAGCIVVFKLTLGNYLTPTLLGGKNSLWFTEQIHTQFITRFNWEQGATFGFFAHRSSRTGLFFDRLLLASLWTSLVAASWVTRLAVLVGTTKAFLIARGRFLDKQVLSLLMLAPLVVPGVILGISTLAFASRMAQFFDDVWVLELDFLRPGLPLVVLGQFSYIVSIATLVIMARLKRFHITLEEAAYNLGASRVAVFMTITLPALKPALIGAVAIWFLMSFENFNTTLMLVGSNASLTVMMRGRMRQEATPVLNAVSLFLMLASAGLALSLLRKPRADGSA